MNKDIDTILKQLKPKKQQGGLAFEYAMAKALSRLLEQKAENTGKSGILARIEHTPRLDILRKTFDNLPVASGRKTKVANCAKKAAAAIMRNFPDLEGPIRLIGDDAGRETEDGAGDVCDLEVGRGEGGFLGISCKLNNDELKHPRMSATSSLAENCLGSSNEVRSGEKRQAEIFGEIERAVAADPDQKLTWKNWKEGEEGRGFKLIQELKTITLNEIKGRLEGNSKEGAGRMLEFVLGTRDYVLVRADDKNKDPRVELRLHNPRGTLGRGFNRTTLPDRISEVVDDSKGDGAAFIVLFGGDGGLGLRFRLHNASTSVQSSLKWSVRWVKPETADAGRGRGNLSGHCWEVEDVSAEAVGAFGEDFLPSLPASDEIAVSLGVAASLGREGRDVFLELCETLPLTDSRRGALANLSEEACNTGGGAGGRAALLLDILQGLVPVDRLPSKTMVEACAVRASVEGGQPGDEARTAAGKAAFGEVLEAVAPLFHEIPGGEEEGRRIIGSLLPPLAEAAFRFGVHEGSRAKSPTSLQRVKTALCEGWRGEDTPLRRALQAVAVLNPSLVSKTEAEKGGEALSTMAIWETVQEDIRQWMPISMAAGKWERRLTAFAGQTIKRLGIGGGMEGAAEVTRRRDACSVVLAGYTIGTRYTTGFPFKGSEAEQSSWLESLPGRDDGEWYRAKVGTMPIGMSVWPDEVRETACMLRGLMEEEGMRGDAIGTAMLLVSLDGRPIREVFGKLAGQLGGVGVDSLVEGGLKVGLADAGTFCLGDADQRARVAGVMAICGRREGGLAPSDVLLSSVAGLGAPDVIMTQVADEAARECVSEDEREVSRNSICLALGAHGLIERPYPVAGGEEVRRTWKAGISGGQRAYFPIQQRRASGSCGTSFVRREDVLRACDKLDELWNKPGDPARQVLEAYAITVVGMSPSDLRRQGGWAEAADSFQHTGGVGLPEGRKARPCAEQGAWGCGRRGGM